MSMLVQQDRLLSPRTLGDGRTRDWQPALDKILTPRVGAAYSHTRASGDAAYFDSAGVMQKAAIDATRFDHVFNGSIWVSKGFLGEKSETNICLQSEDFATTWANQGLTLSVNDAVAVDGNTTMDKLDDGAAGGTHRIFQDKTGASARTDTFSLYVKDVDRRYITLSINSAGDTAGSVFDLVSKTVTQTQSLNGGILTSSSITDLGAGNFRLSITGKITAKTQYFYIASLADKGTGIADVAAYSYTGSNKSLHVWGAAVETAALPTSYIASTTAAVLRAADVATLAITPPPVSSVLLKARTGLGAGILWSRDDGTANERIYVERNASNEIHLRGVTGGVEQFDIPDLGAVADETDFRLAFRIGANDIAAALDGTLGTPDTGATLPTVDTQRICHDYANANHWNATIAAEVEWPRGLANADLQAVQP